MYRPLTLSSRLRWTQVSQSRSVPRLPASRSRPYSHGIQRGTTHLLPKSAFGTCIGTYSTGSIPSLRPPVKLEENKAFSHFAMEHSLKYGDKVALVNGITGAETTHAQVWDMALQVAKALQLKGFKKGEVFAIASPNTPEYAIMLHGIILMGGVVTTASPAYTAGELKYQLTHSKAKYVITIPMMLDTVQEAIKECPLIEETFVFGSAEGATPFTDLLGKGKLDPSSVTIDPKKDVAIIPYSSGTTGLPKGVMLTHFNLVAQMQQIFAPGVLEYTADDVMIGVLPFFHIYGMIIVLNAALYSGAKLITVPKFDPEGFLKILQDYKVTAAHLAPPIVVFLAKHPMVDNYTFAALRECFSAAAPLGTEAADLAAARLGCRIRQGYGMTELSPACHIMTAGRDKYGSVGTLLPNSEMRIVDVITGEPVAKGEAGELWIKGPNVMLGYLNNEEATKGCLSEDGWLNTGDIVRVDDEGDCFIVDRSKELIKVKGLQVAPAELEALLLGHPSVADAAVIGIDDERCGEVPKAFVVLQSGKEATTEELIEYCAKHTAAYKRIQVVEYIEMVPKSPSGKILRRLLRGKN